jgi:DNA-directed RNA polymerase subunit N (RpoN/RPB10)|uniref:DNA-directed RNA polymerase n=1 Tax=viral metagenome TaxID=1070528 RepID=A0A6C0JJR8_9ZZZZ
MDIDNAIEQTIKMIIPIRCVSCNNVLAGKWLAYLKKVEELKKKDGRPAGDEMQYLTQTTTKTAEGRALDELGLVRTCCRRHMLTHVDLI